MRALVATGRGELDVLDVPEPEAAGRALVAVERAGICGTDLKILSGSVPVAYPRILGHELVGTVLEPGPGALVTAGTRVLVDPSIACGSCVQCRADRTHLCPHGALMGRDVDGGFADLVAVDELQLHPVSATVGLEDTPLLQVLGTCVHAQRLVEAFPGHSGAVVGLGVSGLLHVQLLAARGVDPIVGVTRSAGKRALALELGATAVAHPDDAGEVLAAATDGRGADLVVESAGSASSLAQAVALAATGGTVLVFGVHTEAGALPLYDLYFKELAVVSARAARPRDYARAIELVAGGAVRVAPLRSRRFPLHEGPGAFAALAGEPGLLKVLLEVR